MCILSQRNWKKLYNMVLHHIGEDLDLDLRNPAFELQLLISHMLLRKSLTLFKPQFPYL